MTARSTYPRCFKGCCTITWETGVAAVATSRHLEKLHCVKPALDAVCQSYEQRTMDVYTDCIVYICALCIHNKQNYLMHESGFCTTNILDAAVVNACTVLAQVLLQRCFGGTEFCRNTSLSKTSHTASGQCTWSLAWSPCPGASYALFFPGSRRPRVWGPCPAACPACPV